MVTTAMTITCGLCGTDFHEDRGQVACRACPLGADCGLIRCPSCGYENPRVPRWMNAVSRWCDAVLHRFRGRDSVGPDRICALGDADDLDLLGSRRRRGGPSIELPTVNPKGDRP